MSDLKHTVILASAGSGKTFCLAHHFIHLLVHGVAVDSILALTFSRKAAGEITESIIKYLLDAAVNKNGSTAEVARRIGHPELKATDFQAILKTVVDRIHRLGTSTLDSFLVGMLQTFPFELGVAPSIRFMENGSFEAEHLRNSTLNQILNPYALDQQDRLRFMAAFHRSIGGRADASVTHLLEMFIDQGLSSLDTMPNPESWGDPSVIWPSPGNPALTHKHASPEEAAKWATELTDILQNQKVHGQLRNTLLKLIAACADYTEESSTVPDALETKAASGLAQSLFYSTPQTPLAIPYSTGTYTFSTRARDLFQLLLTRVLHIELKKATGRTQGVFSVLHAYSAYYERAIRHSGWMTFADGQNILASHADSLARLDIDYRLDGRIDHWLLDEFQDTSDPQWKGLSNLIDEVIQSTSGERTFFMVGDIKQAIHGWRGGNPYLARQILERYDITPEDMATSFRSCPVVIDTINRCFGHVSQISLPAVAATRWENGWVDHISSNNLPGYVCVLESKRAEETGEANDDAKPAWHTVADILRQLDPIKHNLSVAILTRSNKEAAGVAEFLRRNNIAVTLEGSAPFMDNLVAEALMALIQFSLHPSDTRLWQFILMTPLAAFLQEQGLTQKTLAARILGEIHDKGYAGLLRYWGNLLEQTSPGPYSKMVVSRMVLAAHRFQATGGDIEQFVPFMRKLRWTPPAGQSGISILTIHRAKGLGFDAVILPELDTRGHYLDRVDLDGVLEHHDRQNADTPWRLDIPPRNWAELDPVLAGHIKQQDADASYDELCVLYVALTRAKRGLYMIVPPAPKQDARGLTVSAFLRQRLVTDSASDSCLFELGTPTWFESGQRAENIPSTTPTPIDATMAQRSPRRPRLALAEPSKQADDETSLSWLFDEKRHDVLGFGSALHELLAQVEWVETANVEAIIRTWLPMASCTEPAKKDVLTRFRDCLQSAPIRAALSKATGSPELWREKPFELILGGKLLRGVFDRVVIHSSHDKPTSATILDYKSDRITAAQVPERTTRHSPQMRLYQSALARILRIPEAAVTCELIFVVPAIVSTLA